MAFVIVLFSWSILRSVGQLSLSSVHRKMLYFHDDFALECGSSSNKCISRPQLIRVLNSFDYKSFNDFQNELSCSKLEDVWHALDGKELRGSIDGVKGEKRGENIVLKANHQTHQSQVIGYYSGQKDSEKTVVKAFFEAQETLKGKKYTLDALHNSQELLEIIHQKEGTYLVQIKKNQKILLENLQDTIQLTKPFETYKTQEKSHGRIQKRTYELYPIDPQNIEQRWHTTGIKTLIKVTRDITQVKTAKKSIEYSYYISNQETNTQDLVNAIRGHWVIEKNNYIRDVNFGEDHIKSFKINLQRTIAGILTCVLNITLKMDPKLNLNEKRECLTNSIKVAKQTLKKFL